MFKKKFLAAALSFAAVTTGAGVASSAFYSAPVYASTQAETEFRNFLQKFDLEDISWERVEGKSLNGATIHNVRYEIEDEEFDEVNTVTTKKVIFEEFIDNDDRQKIKVRHQGLTDEDGTHLLLSQKFSELGELFEDLGYSNLPDMDVLIDYDWRKQSGDLDLRIAFEQDEVIAFDYKAELLGSNILMSQLDSFDDNPELLMAAVMALKIGGLSFDHQDYGFNKRLLDSDPEAAEAYTESYEGCQEALREFNLNQLDGSCDKVYDFFMAKEDKLSIQLKPAKPVALTEYLPLIMMLEEGGNESLVGLLIQQFINDLNPKISN